MIIEYDNAYKEDVKDLLLELQEYIVSIDKEKYNIITPQYREEYFKKTMKEIENKGKIFLAKDNNKIIGLIIGFINNEEINSYDFKAPKRGRISELIVSKNCRTKSTGSILLDSMEEYLRSIGCVDILIEVFGYNDIGLDFYKKHNYHNRMIEMTKKIQPIENYICKIATIDEMIERWNCEINNNPNDNKYLIWKDKFINGVKSNKRICYYGIINGKVITEGTAILSKEEAQNSDDLIDENTAYLTAFKTIYEYENKGYFSKLYKFIETDLKSRGYTKLTLGVEPKEIRNKSIYFKWGYNNYIKTAYETYPSDNDKIVPEKIEVHYYSKNI